MLDSRPHGKGSGKMWSFVRRVFFGGVGFTLILGVAIGLNWITSYAEANGLLPLFYIYVLRSVEFLIFACDAVGFGYHVIIEVVRFIRDR
jgi:hypothetical protein